jgi:ABC-type sugar transport system permease subunit
MEVESMKRRRDLFVGFLLILPALIVLGALYVYPLILSVYTSFTVQGRYGLTNYVKAFDIYIGATSSTVWR